MEKATDKNMAKIQEISLNNNRKERKPFWNSNT